MPVREVSNGNLKKELEKAGDKLVLVDFFATWCGPCKMIAPTIDKLSESHPNAVFLKVDVDQNQSDAQDHEVTAMPTFVFFRQSKELERVRGANKDAIESTLNKYYKEAVAFGGEGHSMLDASSTTKTSSPNESDRSRLEQAVKERFGNEKEGEKMTTIRLRLPDLATPVNVRLSVNRTLNEIRHLLCDTIKLFQSTPFEFMEPPAQKIKVEDENKTIEEAKLMNAVLNVKKV